MRPVVRNQADVRNIRHRHSIIFGEDIATRSTDVPLTSNSLSAGFMYTKICRLFVVSLTGLWLFSCSSLDQYTGVGEDIIKDTDPSFMDFDNNFFAVALDSDYIDSAYSLPAQSRSGFGEHPGKLAAGSDSTAEIYGYIHFKIGTAFTTNFDTTDEFDSVVFVFDTLYDSLLPGNYTADTRLSLFSRDSATIDKLDPEEPTGTPLCILKQDSSSLLSGTVTNESFTESVFDQCRASLRCYLDYDTTNKEEKERYCDSILKTNFYLALHASEGSLVRFKSTADHYPAMVIHTHNFSKDDTVYNTDTLRGYPYYVASETESVREEKSLEPLSSWLPGRTAVFKLNLKALWDTMQTTGFDAILSAAVVIKADLQSTDNNDTVPPFNYLLVSDTVKNIDKLDTLFARANRSYGPIMNLKAPSDSSELVLPVDYHLQHYIESKNDNFYLYIRLVSSRVIWNQEVRWSKPRFKAVLTTSK